MPELPEVETIVRTLRPQIRNTSIHSLAVLLPKALQAGADLLPYLTGARITDVSRRAKLLLVSASPDASGFAEKTLLKGEKEILLVFHLKMTGAFFVHPVGAEADKHTRLIFDLGPEGRLFFNDIRTFGYCRIMLPQDLNQWPFWANLGPEPLGMGAKELGLHLAETLAGRKTSIKAALLDQRVVAGVGNIYADESLFRAGIAPMLPAASLPLKRMIRLAGDLQAILTKAIEECGSSIRNYRDANGNAGAFQNAFAVYGRKGARCRGCLTPLEDTRVAGRGTVYCPKCQK